MSARCTCCFLRHGNTLLLTHAPPVNRMSMDNLTVGGRCAGGPPTFDVTEEQTVEGGLDEPAELEPEQGSLDLAPRGHATAPGGRLGGRGRRGAAQGPAADRDDPDDAGLGEAHPDDARRHRGHPARHAATCSTDLETSGRPTRAGDWDVRAYVDGRDAKLANEEALVDLDGGVTSLWLRGDADPTSTTLLDGVLLDLAPVVLDGGRPARRSSRTPTAASCTPTPTSASRRADATAELADGGPAGRGPRASSSTPPTSTTAAPPTSRSSAGRWPSARRTSAPSPTPGSSVDEAADAGRVPLRRHRRAVRRRSPSSAPPAGSGRGCSSSAAPTRPRAAAARRHQPADDEQVRPLGEHAAHHRRRVRRRRRRRRRVTVLPFDSPLGRPDAFGRRIARNTSHLLIDESHVAARRRPGRRRRTPSRSSPTTSPSPRGTIFGRLERAAPDLDAEIADDRRASARREIATRKRPITGLTEFPNLGETLPEREPDRAADDVRRYGASFEALRDEPAAEPRLPGHARHRRRAHRPRDVRHQPARRRRHRRRRRRADRRRRRPGRGVRRPAGRLPGRHRRGLRRVGRRGRGARCASAGAASGDRRRQARATDADDSCAMGVDALDFLTRTREELA